MTMEKTRPLILVTNDDGYKAKGLQLLVKLAQEFGEVVVIGASESQSGRSHAITIKQPLRYKLLEQSNGITRYVVRGTPADGVKLANCKILERKPDLLLSGVNHGSNSSTSIYYSGTMAAVLEGAINQVPAIGFSLLDYRPDADFEPSAPFVRSIIENVLLEGIPPGICLNVNIPAVPGEEIKGVRICRQANGFWKEDFEERKDPGGRKYYWLTGSFVNREEAAEDTDEWALRHNYISVVPVNVDMTAHKLIDPLKNWNFKNGEDE